MQRRDSQSGVQKGDVQEKEGPAGDVTRLYNITYVARVSTVIGRWPGVGNVLVLT